MDNFKPELKALWFTVSSAFATNSLSCIYLLAFCWLSCVIIDSLNASECIPWADHCPLLESCEPAIWKFKKNALFVPRYVRFDGKFCVSLWHVFGSLVPHPKFSAQCPVFRLIDWCHTFALKFEWSATLASCDFPTIDTQSKKIKPFNQEESWLHPEKMFKQCFWFVFVFKHYKLMSSTFSGVMQKDWNMKSIINSVEIIKYKSLHRNVKQS